MGLGEPCHVTSSHGQGCDHPFMVIHDSSNLINFLSLQRASRSHQLTYFHRCHPCPTRSSVGTRILMTGRWPGPSNDPKMARHYLPAARSQIDISEAGQDPPSKKHNPTQLCVPKWRPVTSVTTLGKTMPSIYGRVKLLSYWGFQCRNNRLHTPIYT